MKKITIFSLTMLFFLSGCISNKNTNSKTIQQIQNTPPKQTTPQWLDDPQKMAEGKLTAVGCASKHIDGIPAQKKLAIQRAIDEIAMQKRTKVQTISYNTKTISGNDKSSSMQSSSLHEVENTQVSTKVMEFYTKNDGDICVWVVEN